MQIYALVLFIGPHGTGKCKCSWGWSSFSTDEEDCTSPTGYTLMVVLTLFIAVSYCQILAYRKKQKHYISELSMKENLLVQKELELREEKIQVQKAQEGWKIQEEEITLTKKIGQGSFSNVYIGKWSPLKTVPVAIKVLAASNASIFDDTETLLLQRLRHPRLVLFFGTGLLKKSKRMFIVTEYLDGGDLMSFIRRSASSSNYTSLYPWTQRLNHAMNIAEGMQFLHSQDWVHRDLKSANILIHSSGQCKITDFGLSKCLRKNKGKTEKVARSSDDTESSLIGSLDDLEIGTSRKDIDDAEDDNYTSVEMTSFVGSAPCK